MDKPKMTSWSERQYYSMDVDANVARISGFDEHCQEHWMVVETGKGFRDRRLDALDLIVAHIEAGEEPGEVPDKDD